MAITKDEIQKEYFILFMDKTDLEYICKYKPLVSIDFIKDFIKKNESKIFDGEDAVKILLEKNYIEVLEEPSARFLVVNL